MRGTILLCSIFSLQAMAALAAEEAVVRHSDAHVHGQVELNLAVEGGKVVVELASPAVNFLGFEHAPETAEEIALMRKVHGQIRDYKSVLDFGTGSCVQEDVNSVFSVFGEEEAAHDHDHEESHGEGRRERHEAGHEQDHDAAHDQTHTGHGDIHASYELNCSGEKITQVRFVAFAAFPGIEKVIVQWISDTAQGGAELTGNSPAFRVE